MGRFLRNGAATSRSPHEPAAHRWWWKSLWVAV